MCGGHGLERLKHTHARARGLGVQLLGLCNIISFEDGMADKEDIYLVLSKYFVAMF